MPAARKRLAGVVIRIDKGGLFLTAPAGKNNEEYQKKSRYNRDGHPLVPG